MQFRFTYSHFQAPRERTGSGIASSRLGGCADFREIEAAGFDGILLDAASGGPDAERLVATALDCTAGLAVTLAHRPGAVSPVAFARRLALLASRGSGRLDLFVEPGHPRDGSPSHQASLERLDEYLTLLRRLWLNERPIDHEGKHYSLHRAFMGNRPEGAMPQLRMSGISGTALQVAGRHADVFHLPAGRPEDVTSLVGRLREAASARGRSGKLRFAMPIDMSRLAGGRQSAAISLSSESQRLSGVLASYAHLGIDEFVFTGLDDRAAFGAHVLPALRSTTPVPGPARPAVRVPPVLRIGRGTERPAGL